MRGQKGDSDREAEQPVDKLQLGEGVAVGHPPDSSLSNHVNRLDALQDPPRRPERLIPFGQPYALFRNSMVLLDYVI